MLPFLLATVIIFYFLSGYWLWKLIHIFYYCDYVTIIHLILLHHAAAAKSLQSCPTLWDPIDGSPPGSPIPGILQARTQEGVAISFSSAWRWKGKLKSFRRVRLLANGLQPTWLLNPWDFPGKSTGVGCHCLLHIVSWLVTKTTKNRILYKYNYHSIENL